MGYYMAGGSGRPALAESNYRTRSSGTRGAPFNSQLALEVAAGAAMGGVRGAAVPIALEAMRGGSTIQVERGGGGQTPIPIDTGGGMVTFGPPVHPRMNYANPAALRRSMRRISSFAKAAQKMIPSLRPHRAKKARGRFTKRK